MAIASLEDTVLMRTTRMRNLELDGDGYRARVAAGAWWGEVVRPESARKLAPLAGSCTTWEWSGTRWGAASGGSRAATGSLATAPSGPRS